MSRIRGKNTGPELALRRALWRTGIRYRLNLKLPGRPDVVLPREHIAIFVDGCFWHGCPQHAVLPQSNAAFWEGKLRRNIERDREVDTKLQTNNWHVLRFWEHQVNSQLDEVVAHISNTIQEIKQQSPASSKKKPAHHLRE